MVMLYEVHAFFSNILNNPTAYGFKENMCQDDAGCPWSGNFHILSAFHDIIADMPNELYKLYAVVEMDGRLVEDVVEGGNARMHGDVANPKTSIRQAISLRESLDTY
jgi:hypothetical protein